MIVLLFMMSFAFAQDITGINVDVPIGEPEGVVVAFHGRNGSNEAWINHLDLSLYQDAFLENNYIVLSVDGQATPEPSWSCPDCVSNVLSPMINSLMRYLPPNKQRIIYLGYSAGGRPATVRAMNDPLASALILINSRGEIITKHVHGSNGVIVLMGTREQDMTVPWKKVRCRAYIMDQVMGLNPMLFALPGDHSPTPAFLTHMIPELGLSIPNWLPADALLTNNLRTWRNPFYNPKNDCR